MLGTALLMKREKLNLCCPFSFLNIFLKALSSLFQVVCLEFVLGFWDPGDAIPAVGGWGDIVSHDILILLRYTSTSKNGDHKKLVFTSYANGLVSRAQPLLRNHLVRIGEGSIGDVTLEQSQ